MDHVVSERELLQASLAGSREAFGEVVRRYQSLVCAIAYSATGDIGWSEELAQEAFVRAWKNLRQLEDLGRFRAWLCTIARNLASRSLREKPRDVLHAADSLEQAESVASTVPDPARMAMDKELQEVVWAAVGSVPEKYRETLVLFYRREKSVEEVAAALDLSEQAVRQRLHRGRQYLKAQVASIVEEGLARSGPGKTFAIAVVAALPAIATPTASAAVVGVAAKGTPAAKTALAAGLSGAVLGPILGLLGGVLGAWCSIRNTGSPRERRFMIRMTVLIWVLIFALGGLPLTLVLAKIVPPWVCWICMAAFFVLLVPLIFWGNARQKRIQIEEGTYRRPGPVGPASITRRGLYASFGGGIFGGTAWMLPFAWIAKDWGAIIAVLACDTLLLLVVTAAADRDRKRYWSVATWMVCVLLAVTLAVVNFRWTAWMNAYRQSTHYDPAQDFSLTTINLIVLGVFVALFLLFVTRYFAARTARQEPSFDKGE